MSFFFNVILKWKLIVTHPSDDKGGETQAYIVLGGTD